MKLRSVVLVFSFLPIFLYQAFSTGFHKVVSPNGIDVWAVGNNGRIFSSFNGGATWSVRTLGSATLRSMDARGQEFWVVGDSGYIHRSTTGGYAWNTIQIGQFALRSVTFVNDTVGFIVGDGGRIFSTTNKGETWSPIPSPVTAPLRSIVFTDEGTGWIAGDSGVVLKSTDGGASWSLMAGIGTAKDFYSIDARGNDVVVTGRDATALYSRSGGASWSSVDFAIESRSDVTRGILLEGGTVYYVGGGGFVRKGSLGGRDFEFGKNPLLARPTDIFFYDNLRGWACSEDNDVIIRTTDGGMTWLLPSGTSIKYQWQQTLSASGLTVRGNTFVISGFDKRRVYAALGNRVYVSSNIGESWTQIATIPGGSKTNSFYVHPQDSNLFVAAFGAPDVITRSTNRGQTWTTTMTRNFSEYGMPLEMDPNDPNVLYFGPEDTYFYKSTNFGLTWDTLSRPMFRSPCDLLVVYKQPNVLYCGDGVTGSGNGQIFRSSNGGLTWTLLVTVSGSEIPTIGSSWIDNTVAFATAWGSGGVRRTTDMGLNWTQIQTTGSAWGVDVAKDDPNVVIYGVYSGSTSYLSIDSGRTVTTSSLSGANYAFLAYDRATFLAQQSNGVYKYRITYTVPTTNTQTLALIAPSAGATWQYNTERDITWSSGNISSLRIEYQVAPDSSWRVIKTNAVAGAGFYRWRVPYAPTTQARIRISDANDGVPRDSSGFFSLTSPLATVSASSLDFGIVHLGSFLVDTLHIVNAGTATLVVNSAVIDSAGFGVSRSSFSIPAGSSDTLSVVFAPTEERPYGATLRLYNNSPDSAIAIALSGVGQKTVGVAGDGETTLPTRYFLSQNYPNPFNPTTTFTFDIPFVSFVTLKVYNTLGQEVVRLADGWHSAGRYEIAFDATALPSGLYFYRIRATQQGTENGFVDTKRMVLLK